MGLLNKKLQASTLMETLVATSIIMIVFVVASLVLNNTFRSIIQRDTFSIQNRIDKLVYMFNNDKLALPYAETYENYEVVADNLMIGGIKYLVFETKSSTQPQVLIKYVIHE